MEVKFYEKVFILDKLPTKWTYPLIQPKLIEEAGRRGYLGSENKLGL